MPFSKLKITVDTLYTNVWVSWVSTCGLHIYMAIIIIVGLHGLCIAVVNSESVCGYIFYVNSINQVTVERGHGMSQKMT